MQKINIGKKTLEEFIDNLKGDYKKTSSSLSFSSVKKYFCDDKLSINEKGRINIDIQKSWEWKNITNIKKIYDDISSSNTDFYRKIREFIVWNFISNIKMCPYCGKVPLVYFENGTDKKNSHKRMFQFDHFFPKNTYQKGIINFYNLVPSCNACNHLKWVNNPLDRLNQWWKIFHPYFGWLEKKDDSIVVSEENKSFDEEFNFAGNQVGTAGLLSLQSEHSQFFKLPQIYLNSQDTFNTFKFIQDKRNKMKAEKNNYIKNSLKTETELKNYFFKNYAPETEKDILKYSNWKLKKDLIKDLKITAED